MHNVLLVYKQLSLQFDENGQLLPFPEEEQVTHVLSYDEKPGIQAIANTTEDLPPDENHKTISRDYEYKRLGTVSLLAGIDLQTGEAIPLVRDRHSSKEYIEFLQLLDSKYPKEDKIRLVLDNLQVHTSQETRKYLAGVPGRFEFVFTPKHGSWLNLIEGFFSKLTRQSLKGIRVKTKSELVERIYKYFEEINDTPVVYHWKYRLDEINPNEEAQVETLSLEKVELISDSYTSSDKEELWAIYLDTGCHILACSRITQGTINGAYVYPREFFKAAILLNSTGVIAIHNHPGQTCTPSLTDYEMTKTIIQAGQLLGIELFDHIIVCGGNPEITFSFRKAGLFTQ